MDYLWAVMFFAAATFDCFYVHFYLKYAEKLVNYLILSFFIFDHKGLKC